MHVLTASSCMDCTISTVKGSRCPYRPVSFCRQACTCVGCIPAPHVLVPVLLLCGLRLSHRPIISQQTPCPPYRSVCFRPTKGYSYLQIFALQSMPPASLLPFLRSSMQQVLRSSAVLSSMCSGSLLALVLFCPVLLLPTLWQSLATTMVADACAV
jgi:hypothetical protein